jgi:hypothetical protein
MTWIVIRNWSRYQHRDARRRTSGIQPWIKDYVEQLHDDDHRSLTLAERGLLGDLRRLYAASDGRLTADLRALSRAVNGHIYRRQIERLSDVGFIEIVASKPARISAGNPAGKPAGPEERRGDIPPNPPSQGDRKTLRATGQHPRALATERKRRESRSDFLHRIWDEYPDEEILILELTDRGCRRDEAEDLVAQERARRSESVVA